MTGGTGGTGGAAVVSGAASGIGRATVARLAADGYDVVGLDRDAPAGPVDGAAFVRVDVRDAGAVRAAVREALAGRPPLRAVCAAAGVRRPAPLTEITADAWDDVFAVNVRGAAFLVRECLPHLAARPGGAVVFVGSPSAVADTEDVAYAASKAALVAIARSLALSLMPDGVRVNVVSPGFTATGMTGGADETRRGRAAARNVAGRVNEPADVAAAIGWLCGADAATVSGTVVDVGATSSLPARAVVAAGAEQVEVH